MSSDREKAKDPAPAEEDKSDGLSDSEDQSGSASQGNEDDMSKTKTGGSVFANFFADMQQSLNLAEEARQADEERKNQEEEEAKRQEEERKKQEEEERIRKEEEEKKEKEEAEKR